MNPFYADLSIKRLPYSRGKLIVGVILKILNLCGCPSFISVGFNERKKGNYLKCKTSKRKILQVPPKYMIFLLFEFPLAKNLSAYVVKFNFCKKKLASFFSQNKILETERVSQKYT